MVWYVDSPNKRNKIAHIFIPITSFSSRHAAVMYHNYNSRGVIKFNKQKYYPK